MNFGVLRSAVMQDPSPTAVDERPLTENGARTYRGRGYVLQEDVIKAVDVALALNRPLLVSGEPGCGKTELGYAIARRLKVDNLYLFPVKTTSEARDLFYLYDAIQRFHVAQNKADADIGDFIEFQALGRAIIDAHPREKVSMLLRGRNASYRQDDPTPKRSVVVIDEIDKAPRDFANDLLHEIEALRFRVKEFPGQPETPASEEIALALQPIVIISSNEERQLPDAFLRRCVFCHIPFPERTTLRNIISETLRHRLQRMGSTSQEEAVLPQTRVDLLLDFFEKFRKASPEKRPGVSEMLDAAALLYVSPDTSVADIAPTLVKVKNDAEKWRDIAADQYLT